MVTRSSLGRAVLATVLALVLLGTATSAASAATLSIATTGTDGGTCVDAPCASLDYVQTIVQPGDTVLFAAGAYPVGEATLHVDDVTYDRTGDGEAKITIPPGDASGVQVTASNVTLRNLTITTPEDDTPDENWGVTYSGTNLTLDHMRVERLLQGIEGRVGEDIGDGITVTSSTFREIGGPDEVGTAISIAAGPATVTDSDFSAQGSGIYGTEDATLTATGNVFRGNAAGAGGNGIYLDGSGAGTIMSGNRFVPTLTYGIVGNEGIQALNNWWGCNAGAGHPGCSDVSGRTDDNTEPHLRLHVDATPNPFSIADIGTVSAGLRSSDPASTFTGGPIGTTVALTTSAGSLADAQPALIAGVARTALTAELPGASTVTATLDNASVSTTAQAISPPVTRATLSPTPFAFDAVNAGAGAAPQRQTFTLTNTGNQDITPQRPTVVGADQADVTIGAVACPATLRPTERCTYVVTFAPVTFDATYDASAALHVEYAPDAAATSVLSGRVNEAPFLFVGPAGGQVDVGASIVGTTTAPTSIVFTNRGQRAVRPDSVRLLGQDSGAYTVTADTCTNAAVAPAGTCSVAVRFTPAGGGVTPATLRLAYGAGAGAINVGLTGTGLAKPELAGGLQVQGAVDANGNVVTPGSFPAQHPRASTPQTITFQNSGTVNVSVGRVSSAPAPGSAAFTVGGDRCSGTVLTAGATCSVQVTFSTTATGSFRADLLLPSSQGTVTVPLAGEVTQSVLPLALSAVRTPVRCLISGAALPNRRVVLQANAKTTIGWALHKTRGSTALTRCPPAPRGPKHTTKHGAARASGTVQSDAAGAATVRLSTLLPARARRAMTPGLYRVTFVARNAAERAPERVILIRILADRP